METPRVMTWWTTIYFQIMSSLWTAPTLQKILLRPRAQLGEEQKRVRSFSAASDGNEHQWKVPNNYPNVWFDFDWGWKLCIYWQGCLNYVRQNTWAATRRLESNFNIWVLQIPRCNHPPMKEFPLPLKPEQVVCRTCWYFGDPLTSGDPWTSPSRSRATMIFEVNILAGFTLIHIMLGYGGYSPSTEKYGDFINQKNGGYSMI